MKLFEYESKSLAQNLGINTPRGGLASTPDEARDIHKRIGGEVVIKAQVLVAGRGKAGGIKFGSKPEETRDRASEILSMTIKGEKVKNALTDLLSNLYRLSVIYDAELVESNPLVETNDGKFVTADLRVIVDDNSLFRHPEFQERAKEASGEVTPLEAKARENGLAFVELDGDIGIMGNGAGLVMATLDMVNYYGGKPANFCDVGGGANAEHVATALQIIQGDQKVSRVFINILAGITRCDEVAKGIVDVKKVVGLKKPLVVRMQGTNFEEGKRILNSIGITTLEKMDEAARLVVASKVA